MRKDTKQLKRFTRQQILSASDMISKNLMKEPKNPASIPPPLPVKQRRELFAASRISSRDSGSGWSGSSGSLDPDLSLFIPEVDAYAQQVGFDRTWNQFSHSNADLPPPPLPKKTLNRTNSLPEVKHSPYLKKLPLCPAVSQNNPVSGKRESYSTPCSPMSREMFSSSVTVEKSQIKFGRLPKSQRLDEAVPRSTEDTPLNIKEVTLSTPDQELNVFFSNLKSKEEIYDKVVQCHLVSLCHIGTKLQEILNREEQVGMAPSVEKWMDFDQLDAEACCEAGDAWYYRVRQTSGSRKILAAKVHKTTKFRSTSSDPSGLSIQKSVHPHFNIQQLSDCFTTTVPSSTPSPTQTAISVTELNLNPSGQKAEEAMTNTGASCLSHQLLLTQQVPYQNLADWLEESQDLHRSHPEDYEHLACLLLLQLCMGLEHLKKQGIVHRNLRPENLLLIQCSSSQQVKHQSEQTSKVLQLPRLVISNFSKATQITTALEVTNATNLSPNHARLEPELLSKTNYREVDNFQVGILIYEMLHKENPFENCPQLDQDYSNIEMPPISRQSVYSEGLQRLALLLLHPDPCRRLPIQKATSALQVLLWGPWQELFGDTPVTALLLENWMDIKRALLMQKFAEKLVEEDGEATLEEWLCCQYLTNITETALKNTIHLLHTQ
ncbi:protein PEAK3 isoform X2 [Microcaecilia unicolor]|uniref:Uncharacterized protein PEAK3 isoform X2 n=1 Tax=Microcaecilia unicolor TaxID=1415580 RepID=A0A6P7Z5G6_9AMPH|nr:uncharacterized protein PEAK3 isoform X2 [Microcaecilia unicolor]